MQQRTKNRKTQKIQLVSLIIPAYKQEKTIERDLCRIRNVMDQFRYDYEIIVVVDGKIDKTFENASKVKFEKIKVVGYKKNHGKGYAVRYGMVKSRGEVVGFLDSGGDLSAKALPMMLEQFLWNDSDIIIGSKRHPLSKVNYPRYRRILSWGYQQIVKLLFSLDVRDTQVGMKLYRRKVLEDVLPRLLVKKFAFDIEILAVAYYLGYRRVDEAPIELNFPETSSITSKTLWRIIFNMLWDTLAVFYRLKILHYYDSVNKHKWIYDKNLIFRVNID